MALDRFVYWIAGKPNKSEVGRVLRIFVGEAGTVKWTSGRWFCTLPGKPTNPLKGLPGTVVAIAPAHDERWFEVHCGDDNLDVITRTQDEFTNGVAETFQKLCARIWKDKIHKAD